MGFVSGLLGIGEGAGNKGFNYEAQEADINNPITQEQLNQAYAGTQGAMGNQQNLINQMYGQNALKNQSNVYEQQQQLANMYMQGAQGQGPNPALQQFQNATGQNVQNQAALMASQRGANQNAGLLARNAANVGANIQQNAVGQGAALQAQQQMGYMQGLAGQQNAMAGNLSGMVGNLQNNVYNQAALQQANQNAMLGAQGQFNQAKVSNRSSMNAANAGVSQSTMGAQAGVLSGVGQAIAMPGTGKAFGGEIENTRSVFHGHYNKMMSGAMVPGKAEVKGDSFKNDKVHTMLSPGEIVIPRSIALSKDAAAKSAKFVAAVKAKSRMKK